MGDASRRSGRWWWGWLIVLLAFVELLFANGPVYNYSILFLSFKKEFGKSAALTGWVGSIANALLCCGSPVSVVLIRRLGPRVTSLLGVCLYCGGYIITSFMPTLEYTFLTYGLLVGFGTNFMFQSICFVLLVWFPDKHCSRATALALIGTSVGVLVSAPAMNALIERYNWRNTVRILGASNLLVSVVYCAFTTLPKRTVVSVPGEGAHGDVQRSPGEPERPNETDAAENINEAEENGHRQQPKPRHRLVQILQLVDTWLWCLCLAFGNLGWSFVIVSYASYMEYDLHSSREQISIALILFAVGEIVGKIFLSVGGDHLPFLKLYVVAAGSILGGLASGLLTILKTLPGVFAISFFLGLFRAGSYGMPLAAAMEIFGEHGEDVVSTIVLMPWGLGIFIGAPLSGGLYDLTGNYTLSLIVIAGIFFCSAGSVLAIPARRRLRGRPRKLTHSANKIDDIGANKIDDIGYESLPLKELLFMRETDV